MFLELLQIPLPTIPIHSFLAHLRIIKSETQEEKEIDVDFDTSLYEALKVLVLPAKISQVVMIPS